MDLVEILWTGGYDSTFRIIQLSRLNIKIQPYYLSDKRKSENYELKAIESITLKLKEHAFTKCVFLPLIIIGKENRIDVHEISTAFKQILQKDFIGSQYEWLAQFATKHRGIELSVHEDDKAIGVIQKYGKLLLQTDEVVGDYYIVNCKQSSHDICLLFRDFHFPLAKYTKLQMKEFYLENGYEEIMEMTWFCHSPINGKPCGMCNPCRYTIEEGMKERLPKAALVRYYMRLGIFYKLLRMVNKRLLHIIGREN